MPITTDQINEAKQQGYSDSEIADYLSNKGYSDQIKEARNNGYGDDEIVGFLSQKLQPQTQPENRSSLLQNLLEAPQAIGKAELNLASGLPESLGNAAIGAVQTATDLGEAGARFVERKIYGDNLNQENFGDRLAKQVALREQEQSQYPISKRIGIAIGETLPYLTTGSGLGSKIASMPFKGSNIAGLVVGSGINGLVSQGLSAQEKPGLENRINKGLEGGLISSVVGGLIGAGGELVKGGRKFFAGSDPKEKAVSILSKYLQPEEANNLADNLIAKGDRQVLVPDIANDDVKGLTRLLGKTDGSKNIIANSFNNRTATSNKRVTNLVNDKISSEAYFGKIDDIIKRRQAMAEPFYKKAYEEGNIALNQSLVNQNDKVRLAKINELVDDDRIKKLISDAREKYGINKTIPDTSIEVLHGARRRADYVINNTEDRWESSSYRELRKKIDDVIHSISPSFKKADSIYAGESKLIDAQKLGAEFSKYRPEELKKIISNYTGGEKEAFKVGVRENLMTTIDRTVDGGSAARRIFGKPENRDKLKIVFNNPKEYRDFGKKLLDEIRIFDTKQRILGGSRTDINLAEEGQIIDKIVSGKLPKTATEAGLQLYQAAADSLKRRYIGLNDKSAKELANILVSKQKSIEVLKTIANRANPEQKQIIEQVIKDITPQIIGANLATKAISE